MGSKVAIFYNEDVKQFLRAARTLDDEVKTYMMLAFGMHPKNLRLLKAGDVNDTKGDIITRRGVLDFKRAKNQKSRRELISTEIAEVIWDVVKRGKLKASNTYYELICKNQGRIAIPHYEKPPVSPYTLRHTYILNQLRVYSHRNDIMDFVAKKAGCTREVVLQNYIDFESWENLQHEENKKPLDLTHWIFGEELR